MDAFSDTHIKKHCPHCDLGSFALEHPLKETQYFRVVCDEHPFTEGHILIIPKRHVSCIGDYSKEELEEFLDVYREFSEFIRSCYRDVASFEHGIIGQTVFHSHVHVFPFDGSIHDIVPEGDAYIREIDHFSNVISAYRNDGQYLFVSVGKKKWLVDTELGTPRFFRDRFASALGVKERGNWKHMHGNATIMNMAHSEIRNCLDKWKIYSSFQKNNQHAIETLK